MNWFGCGLVIPLLLGGLTACSKPYDPPVVDAPAGDVNASFDGLVDLMQAPPPASSVRVLWRRTACAGMTMTGPRTARAGW